MSFRNPPMASRNEIRAAVRRRRRALTADERRRRSDAIVRQLTRSALFLRSRHVAFYLPNDGEVDLTGLIRRAWRAGKHCYLPVLGPVHHNRLWFVPYRPGEALTRNRFGIPEPLGGWRAARRPWTLDLVLTPLVAFDLQGNRLGMGGGFYDRTLAYLDRRDCWEKPRLLGVAYEFQRHDTLPRAPWDVPLHAVVTERNLYRLAPAWCA